MDTHKPTAQSSLNFFSKSVVLVTFGNSFEQETAPVTSSNAPVVEFVTKTDRHLYFDLKNIELKVETYIGKGANGNTNLEMEVVDVASVPIADDRVAVNNNTLHSLFSNRDVLINNETVQTSHKFYAQRAFIETELSNTQGRATLKLLTRG